MRLSRARIQNYRSIIDTGEFEVEQLKTILVGPNEAGKTAILQALQQINPPPNVKKLNPLRDYPRSQYTKISRGDIEPKDINVVSVIFKLDDEDREKAPKRLTEKEILYKFERRLDNSACHQLIGVDRPVFSDVKIDLLKLVYHLDRNIPQEGVKEHEKSLEKLINDWADNKIITNDASTLKTWLDSKLVHVDEENEKESERWRKLSDEINYIIEYGDFLKYLDNNKPIFVLYSNYFRVKPIIHLGNLAKRIASNTLDDDSYDYGNICLLNLLGFSAEELSGLGKVADPSHTTNNLDTYREKLDKRSYELNAASVELTTHIVKVWNPNESKS